MNGVDEIGHVCVRAYYAHRERERHCMIVETILNGGEQKAQREGSS